MHESTHRLLEYAKTATANSRDPILSFKDLGDRLGVTSAVMSNWKARGVSKAGAIAAEREFGCSADFILRGGDSLLVVELKVPPSPGDESSNRLLQRIGSSVSQPVNFDAEQDRLQTPLVPWEKLMSAELPKVFRVTIRDTALAPELLVGDELVFDRDASDTAQPGDLVLLRDGAGNHYARILKERRPGERTAHALSQAFDPLDFAQDDLEVVGVCVEQRRKRSWLRLGA